MTNEIIDIICTNCTKTKYGTHIVSFVDSKKRKYQIDIHDAIPIGTTIKLNTFYHDFVDKGDFSFIRVKQKFPDKQPNNLELMLIAIVAGKDGFVLTLRDTTTLDIFKFKVISTTNSPGTKMIFNLKKDNMLIQSSPHFYENYSIENWLCFSRDF